MRYSRFEQLPVWMAAIDLARDVFTFMQDQRAPQALRYQLERAVLSISNNIAEGFERGTNRELLSFLYIARGSAGEVRSMLCLLKTFPAFASLATDISRLSSRAELVSRQLRAWAINLQRSGVKGYREPPPQNPEATAEEAYPYGDDLEFGIWNLEFPTEA